MQLGVATTKSHGERLRCWGKTDSLRSSRWSRVWRLLEELHRRYICDSSWDDKRGKRGWPRQVLACQAPKNDAPLSCFPDMQLSLDFIPLNRSQTTASTMLTAWLIVHLAWYSAFCGSHSVYESDLINNRPTSHFCEDTRQYRQYLKPHRWPSRWKCWKCQQIRRS